MKKIWMHVIASVVGFVAAGLIVFLVFGNASRQGAAQDGSAPGGAGSGSGTAGTLCGTIPPAQATSPDALAKVPDNLPAIVGQTGNPIAGFKPANQKQWLARVVASAGFCLDEIAIGDVAGVTRLSISTVEGMSEADAAAFTGAALVAAHQPPLGRPVVEATTFVGDQRRTIRMSERAATTFEVWRQANGATTSVTDLVRFARSARLGAANLQIRGWS